MKSDITLFPEIFTGFVNTSIVKRAIDDNKVEISIINIRDFLPINIKGRRLWFGGGQGMVLMPEPIFLAVESVKTEIVCYLMTPRSGL